MTRTIEVHDRFIAPTRKHPKGLWERKIGDGPWEPVRWGAKHGELPVIFLNTEAAWVIQKSIVSEQEAGVLMSEQCSIALLEEFESSFEGTKCAVCASTKWADSFFCRACSLRLMRKSLTGPFAGLVKTKWMTWTLAVTRKTAIHWDLCKDYLLVSTRMANERGESDAGSDEM